jgi:hypothetical protein
VTGSAVSGNSRRAAEIHHHGREWTMSQRIWLPDGQRLRPQGMMHVYESDRESRGLSTSEEISALEPRVDTASPALECKQLPRDSCNSINAYPGMNHVHAPQPPPHSRGGKPRCRIAHEMPRLPISWEVLVGVTKRHSRCRLQQPRAWARALPRVRPQKGAEQRVRGIGCAGGTRGLGSHLLS